VTFKLKVTFVFWNVCNSYTSRNIASINMTCLYMNRNRCALLKLKDILRTGSCIHLRCGNISETVLDRNVVTTDHSDLQMSVHYKPLIQIYGLSNSGNSNDLEWPSRSFTCCEHCIQLVAAEPLKPSPQAETCHIDHQIGASLRAWCDPKNKAKSKKSKKNSPVRDWWSTPTYCQLQSHVTQKLGQKSKFWPW